MGNTAKNIQEYEIVRSFKRGDWINKDKKEGYQVWQNTVRNIRADVYPLPNQVRVEDLNYYEMRHNGSPDIVQVHNLEIDKDKNLCSNSAQSHVFVERIPYRLSQVNDLSPTEALTVLRSAYGGFNTLATLFGPVEPYDDLICFNEEGRPKVWVNSNLAQNRVQKQRQQDPIKNLQTCNEAYVNKIFDMVENKTKQKKINEMLTNKLRQTSPKSYFTAQNVIQQFAAEQGIQIPQTIQPRNLQPNQNGSQYYNSPGRGVESYNYTNVSSQGPLINNSNVSPPYQQQQNQQFPTYQTQQNSLISQPIPPPIAPPLFISPPSSIIPNPPIRQPGLISTTQPQTFRPMTASNKSCYSFAKLSNSKKSQTYEQPLPPPQNIFPQNQPQTTIVSNGSKTMTGAPLKQTISENAQIIYHPNSSMFTIKPQASKNTSSLAKVVPTINTVSPSKIPFDSPSKVVFQQAVKSSQPAPQQSSSAQSQNSNQSGKVQEILIKTDESRVIREFNTIQVGGDPICQQSHPITTTQNNAQPRVDQKAQQVKVLQQVPAVYTTPQASNQQLQTQQRAQITILPKTANQSSWKIVPPSGYQPLQNAQPIAIQNNYQYRQVPPPVAVSTQPALQKQEQERERLTQSQQNSRNMDFGQMMPANTFQKSPQNGKTGQPQSKAQQPQNQTTQIPSEVQIQEPAQTDQHEQQYQQEQHHQVMDEQTIQQKYHQFQQQHQNKYGGQQNNRNQQEEHEQQHVEENYVDKQLQILESAKFGNEEQTEENKLQNQFQKMFNSEQMQPQQQRANDSEKKVQVKEEKKEEKKEKEEKVEEKEEKIEKVEKVEEKVEKKVKEVKEVKEIKEKKVEMVQIADPSANAQNIQQNVQHNSKQNDIAQVVGKQQVKNSIQQNELSGSKNEKSAYEIRIFKNFQKQKEIQNASPKIKQQPKQFVSSSLNQSSKINAALQPMKHVQSLEIKSNEGESTIEKKKSSLKQQNVKVSDNYSNTTGLPYMYKNKQKYSQQYDSSNRIPDNAKYQDIQEYIRSKYKTYIKEGSEKEDKPKFSQQRISKDSGIDVNQMADYVTNKYNQYSQQSINSSNNENVQFSFRPNQQKKITSKGENNYSYTKAQNNDGNKYSYESSVSKSGKIKINSLVSKGQGNDEQHKNQEGDLLDVGFMERSLDKRYSANQPAKHLQSQKNKENSNDQQFDVKRLQQNLIRFEESRVGSRDVKQEQNLPEPLFQTSQVSKINSIDYRLTYERKSTARKDYKNDILPYDYGRSYGKGFDYQQQRDPYPYDKKNSARGSKVSKDLQSIDDKFNKYVKNTDKTNSYGYIKPIRQKQENLEDYDSGARMVTGHFGQTNRYDEQKGYEINSINRNYKSSYDYVDNKPFTASDVSKNKNISYNDLRKYLWS